MIVATDSTMKIKKNSTPATSKPMLALVNLAGTAKTMSQLTHSTFSLTIPCLEASIELSRGRVDVDSDKVEVLCVWFQQREGDGGVEGTLEGWAEVLVEGVFTVLDATVSSTLR